MIIVGEGQRWRLPDVQNNRGICHLLVPCVRQWTATLQVLVNLTESMQAAPSIALVVIERNESRCIKLCLLKVRDFVDRMPELVTPSQAAYEQLAVELATQPERLTAIKQKLARNRQSSPLFDTERFTRNLEHAYREMFDRHQAGLPPDHISVTSPPA